MQGGDQSDLHDARPDSRNPSARVRWGAGRCMRAPSQERRHGGRGRAALSRRVLRHGTADVGREARLHPPECRRWKGGERGARSPSCRWMEVQAPQTEGRELFATIRSSWSERSTCAMRAKGYEITIRCGRALENGALKALRREFDELHKLMFGHTARRAVEIVGLSLAWNRPRAAGQASELPSQGLSLKDAMREVRKAASMARCSIAPFTSGMAWMCASHLKSRDPRSARRDDRGSAGHAARVDEFKNILSPLRRAYANARVNPKNQLPQRGEATARYSTTRDAASGGGICLMVSDRNTNLRDRHRDREEASLSGIVQRCRTRFPHGFPPSCASPRMPPLPSWTCVAMSLRSTWCCPAYGAFPACCGAVINTIAAISRWRPRS